MSKIFSAFFSSFTISISLFVFGYVIFGIRKKDNHLYRFIVMLMSVILHSLIFFFFTGTTKTILICLIFMFTFKLLFKVNLYKAFLAAIIYVILLIIPDMITLTLIINVLDFSKEFCYNSFAGGIISNITVSLLMIILTFILRKPLKMFFNYNLSLNKRTIILSAVTIIFIAIFIYKFLTAHKDGNSSSILIYLMVVFVFIIFIFYFFKQGYDNNKLRDKYDDLLNVMKNYESDIEAQRTIVHETRNEFMTIRCKIEDNDKKTEILKYIDSIIGDKINPSTSKYSKFRYLPQNGLKGFFYYKFMEAERIGINVSVNISSRIENSFLKNIDTKDFKNLVRIIGVYLDNAIEASSNSKEKKLGIEIYIINGNINIIISNTFINEIDSNKLGKSIFSTKGKNRGHGLLLVDSILNNNKIFVKRTEIKKNIFVQQLTIKNRTECDK